VKRKIGRHEIEREVQDREPYSHKKQDPIRITKHMENNSW